jgi:hypothetical protein
VEAGGFTRGCPPLCRAVFSSTLRPGPLAPQGPGPQLPRPVVNSGRAEDPGCDDQGGQVAGAEASKSRSTTGPTARPPRSNGGTHPVAPPELHTRAAIPTRPLRALARWIASRSPAVFASQHPVAATRALIVSGFGDLVVVGFGLEVITEAGRWGSVMT